MTPREDGQCKRIPDIATPSTPLKPGYHKAKLKTTNPRHPARRALRTRSASYIDTVPAPFTIPLPQKGTPRRAHVGTIHHADSEDFVLPTLSEVMQLVGASELLPLSVGSCLLNTKQSPSRRTPSTAHPVRLVSRPFLLSTLPVAGRHPTYDRRPSERQRSDYHHTKDHDPSRNPEPMPSHKTYLLSMKQTTTHESPRAAASPQGERVGARRSRVHLIS